MELIKLQNVKKYYNERLILNINNFSVFSGERIGLVGVNGSGKTTLLKCLIKEISVDEGIISLLSNFSYISQSENINEILYKNEVSKKFNAPLQYEEHLSGGEKVKMKISHALSENSPLIFLDEPTQNLDLSGINYLESLLKKYTGTFILVSHDRNFLDSLCTKIIEIDDGTLTSYIGNYSSYLNQKEHLTTRKEFEYESYLKEKNRLTSAIIKKESLRDGIKKCPKRMGNSEARLHKMGDQSAKKNLDGNIKSLKSRLIQLDIKEKPKGEETIKIKIQPTLDKFSKIPISIEDLTLRINNTTLIEASSFSIKRGRKTVLVGDNGSGKSTLLREIIKNTSSSIKIAPNVKIGYFDQEQKVLIPNETILENIKKDSSLSETFIRINLDGFGFKGDDVYKKAEILSGGEKVKVALCKVILSDNNLLILDEPTNYLDINALKSLEETLINMEKTLLFVSHDKNFIEKVATSILEISNKTIIKFTGSYSEYIKRQNTPPSTKEERASNENIMLLKTKLAEVISLLSIEKDTKKLKTLDKQYNELLFKLRNS